MHSNSVAINSMSIPVGATVTITTSGFATTAAQQPKAAAAVAQLAETAKPSKRTTTPKASKPASQPKADKPVRDGKAVHAAIRLATTEGRYDDARRLAADKGWSHVVDSVNAHEAKHGQPKAETEQATATTPETAKPSKSASKAAAKPTKSARPKCAEHNRFLSNAGVCYSCSPELNPYVKPKADEAPAPTKSVAKAAPAKRQPKAAPTTTKPLGATKSLAAGQVTKAATSKAKPSKELAKKAAPTKSARVTKSADDAKLGTGLTASLSENDLALYWLGLADAGHRDLLEAALNGCQEQLAMYVKDGNKLMGNVYKRRVANLEACLVNVKAA